MKDVQCYELFRGIALKNHACSFHFIYILLFFLLFEIVICDVGIVLLLL